MCRIVNKKKNKGVIPKVVLVRKYMPTNIIRPTGLHGSFIPGALQANVILPIQGDGLSKEEREVTLEYKNKRIEKVEPENNSSI